MSARARWGIGIFLLALAARLLYLGLSYETRDHTLLSAMAGADGYQAVATNLIEGHGLTSSPQPPYEPYSFRPPLYHLFIAGSYHLFGGWWGFILLQILVGSLVPLIAMALASYLATREWIPVAVGVILALEPSAVLYSDVFYSETVFTALFLGSLWALFEYVKRPRLWCATLSAFLMGLATLTRPTTEFVPVLIAAVLLWESRKNLFAPGVWKAIGLYAGVFLLVLSPWVYRNWATFGVAGISPQTGVNLRTTLLPTILSIENGTTWQEEADTLSARGIKGPNEASIADGAPDIKAAIPELLAHPKGLALSAANSVWSFFVMDGVLDLLRHVNVRPAESLGRPSVAALFGDPAGFAAYFARNLWGPLAFILAGRLAWIAITAAFVYGAWRYAKEPAARPAAVVAVALVLYFAATAVITGYGLTARYRLPVNAFVVTFALGALAALAPAARAALPRARHG